MIKQDIKKVALIVTGMFVMATTAQAGPLWTYSAPSPSSVSVSDGGSATVTYTVTSLTNKPKSLALQTNPPAPYPATPGLTASVCNLPAKGSTCTLTLTIDGTNVPTMGIHAGPYMCQANSDGTPNPNQCYRPSAANLLNITKNATQLTSLSVSVSNLALSVAGYTEYGVTGTPMSGVARIITIINTGSRSASNLSISYPAWPTGTTTTTTCGSTLAAGASCTITIQPGNTATSDGTNACTTGVAPTSQTISVSANNANSVSSSIVILGYGCIYQGGYVYAFDDTTSNTGSVGGKVATTSDQAAAIIWSSNGAAGSVSYDTLPGIDETSTSTMGSPSYNPIFTLFFSSTYTNANPFTSASFAQCNGNLDGSCNTGNILTFYNQFITNFEATAFLPAFTADPGPTNITYYAAGLCKQTIASYADWYLPAICEMGYKVGVCGSSGAPTLQNIQSSLIDMSGFMTPADSYWSSTEYLSDQQGYAWFQSFHSAVSDQDSDLKSSRFRVRCSRALTL